MNRFFVTFVVQAPDLDSAREQAELYLNTGCRKVDYNVHPESKMLYASPVIVGDATPREPDPDEPDERVRTQDWKPRR